jgi:hypothetical protein
VTDPPYPLSPVEASGPPPGPPSGPAATAFGLPPEGPPSDPAAGPAGASSGGRGRLIAGIAAVVVVCVGAFFGTQALASHGATKASSTTGTTTANGNGTGAAGTRRGFGGGTFGTVKSVSADGFTVTDQNGATLTVTTSGATTVTKSSAGALGDIKIGDNVTLMASGTAPALVAGRITDTGSQPLAGFGGGLGGGFGGGRQSQNTTGGATGGTTNSTRPAGAGPGGGANFVRGTVASLTPTAVTVSEANGTSVAVTTNSSTTVVLARSATIKDIAVGDTVVVRGTTTGATVAAVSVADGLTGFGRPNGTGPGAGTGTGTGNG